jgi:hypothetical protein
VASSFQDFASHDVVLFIDDDLSTTVLKDRYGTCGPVNDVIAEVLAPHDLRLSYEKTEHQKLRDEVDRDLWKVICEDTQHG